MGFIKNSDGGDFVRIFANDLVEWQGDVKLGTPVTFDVLVKGATGHNRAANVRLDPSREPIEIQSKLDSIFKVDRSYLQRPTDAPPAEPVQTTESERRRRRRKRKRD